MLNKHHYVVSTEMYQNKQFELDIFTPVVTNLGSANSLMSPLRILKLAIFCVSRFCQMLNNVSKVPRLGKGWKTLIYAIKIKMNKSQEVDTGSFFCQNTSISWFFMLVASYYKIDKVSFKNMILFFRFLL